MLLVALRPAATKASATPTTTEEESRLPRMLCRMLVHLLDEDCQFLVSLPIALSFCVSAEPSPPARARSTAGALDLCVRSNDCTFFGSKPSAEPSSTGQ